MFLRNFQDNFCGFFGDIANLLCPPNCLACQKPLDRTYKNHWFCDVCCQKIIVPSNEYCPRCGAVGIRTFGHSAENGCIECSQQIFKFSGVTILGRYSDLLRSLILSMKHDRNGILSGNVARLFIGLREKELRQIAPEIVVPIPMHFVRKFFRGVNNPVHFAREIEAKLKIPAAVNLIKRTRYTEPQFNLKPKQRFSNVHGAFIFSGRKKMITGKRVLLVDDIMTTGATCNEAARILLDSGATSVSVAVYGRTMKEKTE